MDKRPPDICKSDYIRATLDNIHNATSSRRLQQACKYQQSKLPYTAPELMDIRWNDVYKLLCEEGTEDEGLQEMWAAASRAYQDMYHG